MTARNSHTATSETARKAARLRHGNIMPTRGRAMVLAIMSACTILVMPTIALAASGSGDAPLFSAMLSTVTDLVNKVFLPIAIVAAGWKIIYILIFPGLLGSDPFNQVPDGYSLQWDAIWTLVKYRLTGFFKGLLWIGGIWLLFNLIIGIVSILATNLALVL